MKAHISTFFFVFTFLNSVNGKQFENDKGSNSDSIKIPFYFGLNVNGPTFIQIKNSMDSIVFNHEGDWKDWGSQYQKTLLKGKYRIFIKVDQNSLNTLIAEEHFEIIGNETLIDVSVVLIRGRTPCKELIVTKYYGNEFDIKLKRIWNPQSQFEMDSSFLPDYEVLNSSDSLLYGIYHRFSSSMSISWVQLHYITFLRYQKFENGNWLTISCNAPRIQMGLKPNEKGCTLKDMRLDCNTNNFQKKIRYRVIFQYGINNTIVRIPEKRDESFTYIEPHVYQIYDEFTIE
jgi:hypothetical protein